MAWKHCAAPGALWAKTPTCCNNRPFQHFLDLIDGLQVFVAPVFLGDGIRIFERTYRPKGR